MEVFHLAYIVFVCIQKVGFQHLQVNYGFLIPLKIKSSGMAEPTCSSHNWVEQSKLDLFRGDH